MPKISVVDAAKKAKLHPEEFLIKLKEFGIYAEDVQSTFDASKLRQVLSLMKQEDKPVEEKKDETRVSSGVVRRRRRPKKKAKPEPEPQVQPEDALEPETVSALDTEGESVSVAEPVADQEQSDIPSEIETMVDSSEPLAEAETGMVEDEQTETDNVDDLDTELAEASLPEEEQADQAETSELDALEITQPDPHHDGEQIDPQLDESIPAQVEPEADAKAGRRKKKGKKAKKLPIRGITKEPARIVSLPDKKIDTLKPSLIIEEDSPPEQPGPPPDPSAGPKPGKRGRRVVEVNRRGSGKRKKKKKEVYEKDLFGRGKKRKKREAKSTEITTPKAIKRKIKIMEQIQVGEMAHRMGIKAGDLMGKLISMGVMATINQYIDLDTATILAEEYGFEIENISVDEDDIFKLTEEEEKGEQVSRPPVVTVMGHVDHGKTTLLDTIREANVVKGEAGGITQHIGAYHVQLDKGTVVFLDTPGHETFTAMRARGAHITDIVILIVAADDGVMPQTVEAINHSKDADVPIIVAVNKIDKPGADPEKIKQKLTEFGLVPEEWGGDTMFCDISAKQNTGIENLLESVLLQAEVMELTAVADRPATGVIVEARLEKGRGPVATVLVQEGTLKVGDPIVSDKFWGKVRSMTNDRNQAVDQATPSMPVEVVGLGGVPMAGSTFNATNEEKLAKQVAELRAKKAKEEEQKKVAKVSLDDLYTSIQEGGLKELKLIVKADVQGSVEAIIDSLQKLSTEEVAVKVIHSGAGAISETDINFAIASAAIVIGFNIRPEPKARMLAEREDIDIRLYEVIYEMVSDVKDALTGMLEPTFEEKIIGRAEVRDTFHISRIGTIAGCHVVEGKMIRNAKCRLIRDGVVVFNGKISTLKRFKDDAKEVLSGFECGITMEGFNDIKIGDEIEAFEMKEIAPSLN